MRALRGCGAGDLEVALTKMNRLKFHAKNRFAACTADSRLLLFCVQARRVSAGGFSRSFNFPAGGGCRDGFTIPMPGKNLTRHEIFRGKVSRRKNQK
jgi:hypothetical protein